MYYMYTINVPLCNKNADFIILLLFRFISMVKWDMLQPSCFTRHPRNGESLKVDVPHNTLTLPVPSLTSFTLNFMPFPTCIYIRFVLIASFLIPLKNILCIPIFNFINLRQKKFVICFSGTAHIIFNALIKTFYRISSTEKLELLVNA